MSDHRIELAKLAVAIIGLAGTIVAAVIAIRSFRRTERWKRAEFLAHEMKEFFADPRVQTALLLIDWGSRRISLIDGGGAAQQKVLVTRDLQVHALLPHTLLDETLGSDGEAGNAADVQQMRRYTPEEAAIRDCYDTFLDGLERFSSYTQTGLVGVSELRPYLDYWIEDIHSPAKDRKDAAWSAALIVYIQFYRFSGVQWLFRAFGCSIDPSETTFSTFLSQMSDQVLASRLARAVGVDYIAALANPAMEPN
jgi:hypothetical protein